MNFYTYCSERVSEFIGAQQLKHCITSSLACLVRNSGIVGMWLRLMWN